MNEDTYTLLVIAGDVTDINDPYTSVCRYDGMTRAEALDLAEKSLSRGFSVAAWQEDSGEAQADE